MAVPSRLPCAGSGHAGHRWPGPLCGGERPARLPCGLSSPSTPQAALQKPPGTPLGHSMDAAGGEGSRGDADDAQPLLFQIYSQFLQHPAASCMTIGEICSATHSPLCPPPWHIAQTSLPPKPQLIFRLHMATTHGSSTAGTSPGAALASLGTSHLTPPHTFRHRAGGEKAPFLTQKTPRWVNSAVSLS